MSPTILNDSNELSEPGGNRRAKKLGAIHPKRDGLMRIPPKISPIT